MTQSKRIIDECISQEIEKWVRDNLIELNRMPDWSRLFTLCANDVETLDPLEFTVEGERRMRSELDNRSASDAAA